MTARRLPRRLIVGASSAALLAGVVGFVPLLGSASAADCPSWTDGTGDAAVRLPVTGSPAGDNEPSGLTGSDDLDIVRTTFATDAAGGIKVVVTVKGLTEDGANNLPGDEFEVDFNAAGVDGSVYLTRDDYVGAERYAQISDGNNFVTGTIAYDTKTNSVTGTFTPAQVLAGLGKAAKGVKFDTFVTTSYEYVDSGDQSFGGLGFPAHDKSTAATALSYTDAGGCTLAGGSPAPSGTGSPSPSASPSASPSPSGSPSPTPSATPTPSPTSTGTPGALFDQPRKGCVQFKDAAGDADPTPTGQDNETSLDVTQVNLKSPADGSLQVFVALADVAGGLNWPKEGGRYTLTTTIAGKAVVVTVDETGAVTATTVGGTASTDLKPTAKLDGTHSNLVVTLPKAGLEKALKTTLAGGAAVTGTSVVTAVTTPGPAFTADKDASGTTAAEKAYAYGDNTCFLPPAGVLAIDADAAGQFSDATELFATLTDVEESPVQGATVTAQLGGGKTVSAITDEDGIADLVLPVSLKAGATTITTAFAGSDTVGATKATAPFTVLAEKAVLKATAVKAGAKAAVLDDDKHPVAGRPVVFTVGSKKTVVKTNAQGVAVLGRLARGTAVKVSFPAVPGFYLATPTYTVKAL